MIRWGAAVTPIGLCLMGATPESINCDGNLVDEWGDGVSMLTDKMFSAMPVFPLPRTVFMPGAVLPLHVFEPRYRELVAYCLAQEKVMAVATLREGYEEEYYGSPALHSAIGIGEIVAHQPFPDGRCNLALQFLDRAVIVKEVDSELSFRLFQIAPIEDEERQADDALKKLRALLLQLGMTSPRVATEARRLVELDDTMMMDSLARKVLETSPEQLTYLGSRSLPERVRLVYDGVAALMANMAAVGDA